MLIDENTLATLGFTFNRTMYYAKMLEGIIDASKDYHKDLVNKTYEALYLNNSDIFQYIYTFRNNYNGVKNQLSVFDEYIDNINNYIDSIRQIYTRYSNYITYDEYLEYSDAYISQLDNYYETTEKSNKLVYIDIDSLDDVDNLLDNRMYRYNGQYYIKVDGVMESLGDSDPRYYKTLKMYYQAKGLSKPFETIYNDVINKQNKFRYINNTVRLDGTYIKANNNKLEHGLYIGGKLIKGNDIDISNEYKQGIRYSIPTVTYDNNNKITITYEKNKTAKYGVIDGEYTKPTKVTKIERDDNGYINYDHNLEFTTYNYDSEAVGHVEERTETINIKYTNSRYIVDSIHFIDNHITRIDSQTKKIYNSTELYKGEYYTKDFSSLKYNLFNWLEYTTEPNTDYKVKLLLKNTSTKKFGLDLNGHVNSVPVASWKMDSLPYDTLEYVKTEHEGPLWDKLKTNFLSNRYNNRTYGLDTRLKDLFYRYNIDTYKYYRNQTEYEDLKLKIPNKYILLGTHNNGSVSTNGKNYSVDLYPCIINGNKESNGDNKQFTVPIDTSNPIVIGKEITSVTKGNTNKRRIIDETEYKIKYSNNSIDTIKLKTYNDYLLGPSSIVIDRDLADVKFSIENGLESKIDKPFIVILGVGNGTYNTDSRYYDMNGDRIINTYYDKHVEYNDLFTTYITNNYIQTDHDNIRQVTLQDRIINFKKMPFKQYFDIDYNDSLIIYTEHFLFNNQYDIHRKIYSEIDNFDVGITTNEINGEKENTITETVKFKLNDDINPKSWTSTITHDNRKLTNVLYDYSPTSTKLRFVYDFDYTKYNDKVNEKEKYERNSDLTYAISDKIIRINKDNKVPDKDKIIPMDYDDVELKTNYAIISKSSDDIVVNIQGKVESSISTTTYGNYTSRSFKSDNSDFKNFTESIDTFISRSYSVTEGVKEEPNDLRITIDCNKELVNFNNLDGDAEYSYNTSEETIVMKSYDYGGTCILFNDNSELEEYFNVQQLYSITVTIENGFGIKKTLYLNDSMNNSNNDDDNISSGDSKLVTIIVQNNNPKQVKALVALKDATFNDDVDKFAPVTFLKIQGRSSQELKIIMLNANAKATIMSLDY